MCVCVCVRACVRVCVVCVGGGTHFLYAKYVCEGLGLYVCKEPGVERSGSRMSETELKTEIIVRIYFKCSFLLFRCVKENVSFSYTV